MSKAKQKAIFEKLEELNKLINFNHRAYNRIDKKYHSNSSKIRQLRNKLETLEGLERIRETDKLNSLLRENTNLYNMLNSYNDKLAELQGKRIKLESKLDEFN